MTLAFHEFVASFIAIHNSTAIDEDKLEMSAAWIKACRWLELNRKNKRLLLMAFRGFGKSHLACLFIVWSLILNPNFTAIIISATEAVAAKRAAFIRTVIERHPECQHLNPNSKKNKNVDKGLKEKWTRQSFTVVRPGMSLNESVTATSLDSQITGTHSDLILADDVEVEENSKSARQRHELRSRIREFVPIAKKILFIGTPWSEQSIYPEIEERGYLCLKLPVYTETEDKERVYTWASRFDEPTVEATRKEVTSAHFDSQYLLIPASEGSRALPTTFVHRYSDEITGDQFDPRRRFIGKNQLRALVAFWDPATALPGKDDSILAVVAEDMEWNIYLHRIIRLPPTDRDEGWRPQTVEIVKACSELGVSRIIIENSVNPTLDAELKKAANDLKVRFNIERVNVGVRSKKERIASALEVPMAAGRFHAHESVLAEPSLFMEQADSFPLCVTNEHEKDDVLDATAGAVAALPESHGKFNRKSDLIPHVSAGSRSWIGVQDVRLSDTFTSEQRPRFAA